MGIKHIGTSASRDVARSFSNWRALATASVEDFTDIEGVGTIMAESLILYFKNPDHFSLLESLEGLGVALREDSENSSFHPWKDKTFVLTGSLERFSRQGAASEIENLGGRVSSSVSKKTSFVIAGPGAGSKLDKAKKLEVKILDEEGFMTFLEENKLH